ncbi:DUF4386 domain-containing protein [Fulvivirga sp.]|uniref:DUF4386 domain-containing protein n=1 Tax=Fulvivirga sp. TaxID=1931237 RepID=UPI0032EAC8A3
MNPTRKSSLVFGLFFFGTFIFSISALFFYEPLFNNSDYLLLGGFDTNISIGALLEILLAICNIATAIVIYPIFKQVSGSASLGYVASRTVESLLTLSGVVSLMSIMSLRADFTTGSNPDDLLLVKQMFMAFHDWTFLLGPQFCSGLGNGLLLGYIMYRSGAVPKPMAWIGIIGGPLAFIGGVLVLFHVLKPFSLGLFALTSLEIIWELSITVYTIFFGFKLIAKLEKRIL